MAVGDSDRCAFLSRYFFILTFAAEFFRTRQNTRNYVRMSQSLKVNPLGFRIENFRVPLAMVKADQELSSVATSRLHHAGLQYGLGLTVPSSCPLYSRACQSEDNLCFTNW